MFVNGNDDCVIEASRRTPVAGAVDVLVAGGGPAGIAAGIAAAREGASVLLVERYGYLGGMMTGARVVRVMGVGDGCGPKARGVTLDIRKRMEALGVAMNANQAGDYSVDAEVFKWQAAEMLREAGAEVLLHTLACEPILSDMRVEGLLTQSKSGRNAFRAKVVVDCTADADISFRAGCECDNETHDVTVGVVVEGVDAARAAAFERESPERFERIASEARRLNGGKLPGGMRYVKGIDGTDAAELTKVELQARRDCFSALNYLRANMPGWEDARVRETLPQIGVRQSRRIRGEYILTEDDLRRSRHFGDSIARLGAFLLGYVNYELSGLDYDVPYRCLIPRGVDGLLVAGRCISCDYLACNTMRLIVPCLATGQAAGAAAAIAARQGIAPRKVAIAGLREALLRQNVYLGDPDTHSRPSSARTGAALKVAEPE